MDKVTLFLEGMDCDVFYSGINSIPVIKEVDGYFIGIPELKNKVDYKNLLSKLKLFGFKISKKDKEVIKKLRTGEFVNVGDNGVLRGTFIYSTPGRVTTGSNPSMDKPVGDPIQFAVDANSGESSGSGGSAGET